MGTVADKLQKTVPYWPLEFDTSFVVTRKNKWVFKGKYIYFTAVSVYKKLCPFWRLDSLAPHLSCQALKNTKVATIIFCKY